MKRTMDMMAAVVALVILGPFIVVINALVGFFEGVCTGIDDWFSMLRNITRKDKPC